MSSKSVKPAIKFDHTPWERSHSPKPCRGRGSWAFAFMTGKRGWDEGDNVYFSPGGMTLTEAKAWFRNKAPSLLLGGDTVYVGVLP